MVREKTILGAILFSGAYCLAGMLYGIAKYLQATWGFPPAELTFFNFVIVSVCTLPWVTRRGGIKALKTDRYPLLLFRAGLGFALALSSLTAAHMLPLVDAVTLINMAPLWVPLLAIFILRERLSGRSALCILGGFIGMLLIIHPRIQGLNLAGDMVALAAGIFLAITIVVRRKLKNEPWQRVVFYYGVVGALLSAIFMIPSFKMPQGIQWVFFLVMGVFMYLIQRFATIAMHHAKATTLGPLTYSAIIVSGVIGWLVWGQIPTFLSMVGTFAIIVSGILIVVFELRGEVKT